METVAFISTETTDDLIVSFAVCAHDDPSQIESLTLLRTPKYEQFFEDSERGVKVSFELDGKEGDLLEEVYLDEHSAIVRLTTELQTYELDVRKVDPDDLGSMRAVLRRDELR